MSAREAIHNAIMEALTNQLANDNPKEVRETLKRLKNEGWSAENAKKLIGQCVAVEIFDAGKNNNPFNEARYIFNLKNLPNSPLDEDEEGPSFDASIPRRVYYTDECNSDYCPECKGLSYPVECTVFLAVKSDNDLGDFMMDIPDSYYCENCPVVIFDRKRMDEAAELAVDGDSNVQYIPVGIIDWEVVPEEKKDLEFGTDDNPVPLVKFLPLKAKKIGRNEPCPCGSGRKYKKCCSK